MSREERLAAYRGIVPFLDATLAQTVADAVFSGARRNAIIKNAIDEIIGRTNDSQIAYSVMGSVFVTGSENGCAYDSPGDLRDAIVELRDAPIQNEKVLLAAGYTPELLEKSVAEARIRCQENIERLDQLLR